MEIKDRPMQEVISDLGKVSIVPKGSWELSKTYERLDLVFFEVQSYIAKKNVPENTPLIIEQEDGNIVNEEYWQPLQYFPNLNAEVSEQGTFIFNGFDTGILVNRIEKCEISTNVVDEFSNPKASVETVAGEKPEFVKLLFNVETRQGRQGFSFYKLNETVSSTTDPIIANIVGADIRALKYGDFVIDNLGYLYRITEIPSSDDINKFKIDRENVSYIIGYSIYKYDGELANNTSNDLTKISISEAVNIRLQDIIVDNKGYLARLSSIDFEHKTFGVDWDNKSNIIGPRGWTVFKFNGVLKGGSNNLISSIDNKTSNTDVRINDMVIDSNGDFAKIININYTTGNFEVNLNNKINLRGLKGDKGDIGDSGAIKSASAQAVFEERENIDVKVNLSGPDTAKHIHFTFKFPESGIGGIQYEIEVKCTPEDATVYINNTVTKELFVEPNSEVTIRVEKEHYETHTETFTATEDRNGDNAIIVNLKKIQYTVNVTATPEDAIIKINGVEKKNITGGYGDTFELIVEKEHYNTYTKTHTITGNDTVNIELVPTEYMVTIKPTPEDAIVSIDGTTISKPYRVEKTYGETFSYLVSKNGYIPVEGEHTVIESTTIPITLTEIVLEVTPTELVFDAIGGTQEVSINSNTEWVIE